MRYVTFYWSIMGGITDIEEFKTKEEALKNFRANYRSYFQTHDRFMPRDTPCAYGFPHRKYYCMSIRRFKKFAEQEGGAA